MINTMRHLRRKEKITQSSGFSALELIIIIGILALSAGIVIPSLTIYSKLTLRSEVPQNMRLIFEGAMNNANRAAIRNLSGRGNMPLFPDSQELTPSISCCEKNIPVKCMSAGKGHTGYNPREWDTPSWKTLHFKIVDPHWYRYGFQRIEETGFSVQAVGDINCNGRQSFFKRSGKYTGTHIEADLEISTTDPDE
jgi:type II secretory pathway pseudopilin PulG